MSSSPVTPSSDLTRERRIRKWGRTLGEAFVKALGRAPITTKTPAKRKGKPVTARRRPRNPSR